MIWPLLIACAAACATGCGGGAGVDEAPPNAAPPNAAPSGRPLLILLGDTATPASQGMAQALRAAGHVTLDAGADLGDAALQRAVEDRCADASPVDCGALVLIAFGPRGASRVDPLARAWQAGGDGPANGRVRAVVTVDAGYTPPFRVMDGVWERTGLADTSRWQVGMFQSRDDPRAGLCDADGCGVLPLALAHGARGQSIVSACPHAGMPDRSAWLVAAVYTLLHVHGGLTPPPGSTVPSPLPVNACLVDLERERPRPPQPAPLR